MELLRLRLLFKESVNLFLPICISRPLIEFFLRDRGIVAIPIARQEIFIIPTGILLKLESKTLMVKCR